MRGNRGEAVHIARLLHLVEEKVEHDEVEMLDLVGTGGHELMGAHERGYVPADPHPARMRLGGDEGHDCRWHRGVDLDLAVAVIGIPVDIPRGIGRGADTHFGRAGERSLSVDDAGPEDSRAELGAGLETPDALEEFVDVVSHVPDSVGAVLARG